MRTRRLSVISFVGLSLALAGQGMSVTTQEIKLGSGGKTFTSVTVTNTHSRNFMDGGRSELPNRCRLKEGTEGVVWTFVLRGAAVPAKQIEQIGVADEAGHAFTHVCWNSSVETGTPHVEFMAAGPDAAQQLTLKFGKSSAVVKLEK